MTVIKTESENLLINKLISFGFSNVEASIYVYLLQKGKETGGSKIAERTGMHRQYVYLALPKLIQDGLIEEVEHGKQSKYKARPPQALEVIGRKKAIEAGDLAKELNVISAIGHEQDFEIYAGDKQVREYESNLVFNLKEGEIQYVISGASKNFLAYFGDDYEYFSSHAKQKKLTTYYVGGPQEKESLATAQRINPYFQYRTLEGMPIGVTSTVVRHNGVVIYSLAKPPLIYVIHSKIISDEYKAYFDMLWNMAEDKK